MRLADYGRQIMRGAPGHRFQQFHNYRCRRRGPGWSWDRFSTLGLGLILFVGGLAIGWLPGPGGFVAFIGLALLGVEWMPIARLLDWAERQIRALYFRLRGWWRRRVSPHT
jgi:hypothetical protein